MALLLVGPGRRTSTRRLLVLLGAAVAVIRLAYLAQSPWPDEAGYLTVARSWHLGGPNLYGHYFVDRPPLLLLIFRLAAAVPFDQFVRVLAVPFAITLVLAAWWATHQLVGDRGARWAAVAASAFVVTPAVSAQEANGEIFAAPLVMLSVALTIAAVRRVGRASLGLAVLSGVSAGLAVMVKQNFVDGYVFAVVLLVASVLQHRLPGRDAVRVALGGVAGGAVVLLGAVGYALGSGVGVARAWYALLGFRGTALDVIANASLHAPLDRARGLLLLGLGSGMIVILVLLVREAWRCHFTGSPVAWAVAVTLMVSVLGIVGGGSFWRHYLIELAPMLALAAGLWAPDVPWLRLTVAATALSAVAFTVATLVPKAAAGPPLSTRAGQWVHQSGRPGDTATVLYGHPEIQQATGMPSPYPFLWSLPMRTIDPHLTRLRHLLVSRRAPDWLVVYSSLNDWGLDPHNSTRLAIATHYRPVARFCGHEVWLRDGVRRDLAPPPTC